MATKQALKLPTEVWVRIFENLMDDFNVADLWKSYRHVCKTSKDATESLFRRRQLPRTIIEFQLGSYESAQTGEMLLNFEFRFDRLSEDTRIAIFKAEEYPKEFAPKVWERLPEYLKHIKVEVPQHTIQIRRDINDGPIPGISMDYESSELSCDWREMMSAFYGEEKLYHNHTKNWVASKMALTDELKRKMDRGEMDAKQVIDRAIFEIADGSDDSRKMARRGRIQRQYKKLYGVEWDVKGDGDKAKETERLVMMQEMRETAIEEDFSDEENDAEEWEDEDDGRDDYEDSDLE